jgi:hypothetical protein
MVIDYCSLNLITIPDRVPPPMGQEQMDFMAGARRVSPIPNSEPDRHKTAFISECGQFEWNVCAWFGWLAGYLEVRTDSCFVLVLRSGVCG